MQIGMNKIKYMNCAMTGKKLIEISYLYVQKLDGCSSIKVVQEFELLNFIKIITSYIECEHNYIPFS